MSIKIAATTFFSGNTDTGSVKRVKEQYQCMTCAWENPYSPRDKEGICQACRIHMKLVKRKVNEHVQERLIGEKPRDRGA